MRINAYKYFGIPIGERSRQFPGSPNRWIRAKLSDARVFNAVDFCKEIVVSLIILWINQNI